tara:strand:- start:750 stop:995 length:246 start_codon:yes stop_codon:yes gene_type:complete
MRGLMNPPRAPKAPRAAAGGQQQQRHTQQQQPRQRQQQQPPQQQQPQSQLSFATFRKRASAFGEALQDELAKDLGSGPKKP